MSFVSSRLRAGPEMPARSHSSTWLERRAQMIGLIAIIVIALAALGLCMFPKTIATQGGEFYTGQAAHRFYNRTGGTVHKGYVGFIDTAQTDAASTSLAEGLKNIVKVTTALMNKRVQQLVVFNEDADDDGQARATGGGDKVVQILCDGTTDIAKGDLLKPVNGQYYLVKATAGTDLYYAEALEAFTTDGQGLVWCRLIGTARV
jgi:hypothetical protein